MRTRIFIYMMMLLCHLSAIAQTDGYNPSNPPNPSLPETTVPDSLKEGYYRLTVNTSPVGMGGVNTNGGYYQEGSSLYLRAYGYSNLTFCYWMDDEGNTLSTSASLYYTMPARNALVTAVYSYNPANPGNPEKPAEPVKTYTLTLKAKPEGTGSFSPNQPVEVEQGSDNYLCAYTPNSNFKFLRWEDEQGNLVSTARYFYYNMPAANTTLYGVFEYAPGNPANPGKNAWDSFAGEVIVDDFTPGQLSSAISQAIGNSSSADVTHIVVAGKISTNDFSIANSYSNCSLVDLSRTTGATYVPSWCYSNNSQLTHIFLPSSIETIGAYAFYYCTSLESVTLYAVTPPTIGSYAFEGVPTGMTVYVPEGSIELYEAAEGWKDMIILPIRSNVHSLELNLPEECKDGRYKNMALELVNVKSGQKYKYVVTDRLNYIFSNLMKNTTYNAYLKNLSGVVLAEIDSIKMDDQDRTLTFSDIKTLQTVSLRVLDADGSDVTAQTTVRWYDSKNQVISMGSQVSGQVEGYPVRYSVTIPQALGMRYQLPADSTCEVTADDNKLVCQLQSLPKMTIKGSVSDMASSEAMNGVQIVVTQLLNGLYSKTTLANTNEYGMYEIEVMDAPTTLTYSFTDYVSQSIILADSLLGKGEVDLGKMTMKSISGARIGIGFTYTKSAEQGDSAEVQNWYSDYQNIQYSVFNKTRNTAITKFSVQYPTIVLLEEVDDNDVLQLTAISKTGMFMPVVAETTVKDMKASVLFPISQLGGINISFKQTENAKVVAMLYDNHQALVKKVSLDEASATISELQDGDYSLVMMGESSFFNAFYNMAGFNEAGLVENTDYVKKSVSVKSGVISNVSVTVVPFFDEGKLYYTGTNTAFSVNKTKVVAGAYLTLQAKVDFKYAFRDLVSDVQLVFDLPEGNSFVENSMMVGSSLAVYELDKNTVSVTLGSNYDRKVRFCVIPTASGDFKPNAYVKFVLDGKTITQPIGSADFTVESINLNVPSLVSRSTFAASGTAMGNSQVTIYDGSSIVGQTKSLANGLWTAQCQLENPTNLSTHSISAQVVTKEGLVMNTETKSMVFDENAIEISKVHMYHWNPEMHTNYDVVFDYQNPTTVAQKYTYYIYNKQFTFTIEFTDNDTTRIDDVKLRVKTGNGQWTVLPAVFDKKKNLWVANGEFGNMYDGNVPKNVAVSYQVNTPYILDATVVSSNLDVIDDLKQALVTGIQKGEDLLNQLIEAYTDEYYNEELVKQLEEKVYSLYGLSEAEPQPINSEEEAKAFIAEIQEALSDSIFHISEYLIEAELENLLDSAGYSKNIKIGNCEGLNESTLEADGYTKVLLTDSTSIYYRISQEGFSIVNFAANYHAEILLDQAPALASLVARIASDDSFLAEADAFITKAQQSCNEINDKLGQIKDCIDTFKNAVGYAYTRAKETFSKALSSLKFFAANKRAGQAFPGQAIVESELKQTAKSSGKVMMGTHSIGNKLTSAMNSPLGVAAQKVLAAFDIVTQILSGINDLKKVVAIYRAVPKPCPLNEAGAQSIRDSASGHGLAAILFYGLNIAADIVAVNTAVASAASLAPSGGTSALCLLGDLALIVIKAKACAQYEKTMKKNIRDLRAQLNRLKCKESDKENQYDVPFDEEWHYTDVPDADVSIDPSGFVYEGIESNRLQGVTATCYYKETVEDMYGDKHENIVLWDAAEYSQENPLFTDENGMYRWDVPQGLWQVKFEKEGYQTTYSEWLPVPPPQLEVNIGMVQNVQPEVKSAKAYEDGVEIEFSKYMKPETLTADNLYLKLITGDTEEMVKDATVEMLNVEAVSEDDATQYVSKVALKTTKDLGLVDEVYVIVGNRVQSYAGIQMAETYTQKLDVEKKVRQIAADETYNVGYEQAQTITVGALPNDASKGKTLMVKAASNLIASIEAEGATVDDDGYTVLTLDENGQASLTVNGELLGTTALTFKMVDSDISAQSIVNVLDPAKLVDVKEAVASRISGTAVYRGQTVSLTCETEGATIYYTLDGSCPCDEATRVKYDGKPIAINDAMTLKAMAVGVNGSESEVKEYSYTIKQTQLQLNLAEGWNWSSHNQLNSIAAADLRQEYVNRVLTQTHEIYNDPVIGFVGNMSDVSALMGIKVETKSQATMAMSGEQFNPNATAMELAKGWNWIGYPLDQTMTVAEALSKLEAEEGDVLTNLEGGYANYTDGAWTGTLNTMTPGQGYLYKSASSKSFVYNDAIVSNAKSLYIKRLETDPAPWTVNVHRYPNMMCLTAELYDNGLRASTDEYHVGAFVGNECRGVGKWVDGKLYMAVYGGSTAGEQVVFRAVERESGNQSEIQETLVFCADAVGTTAEPYTLNLGETTGITNIGVNSGQTEGIYNVMGVQVRNINHEGVYIVNGQKVLINKRNVNEYVK
ncbi:MAG: chitobiase/beta-hexosaminidase C-terminal domain-containing protein [Prevotella sp.]